MTVDRRATGLVLGAAVLFSTSGAAQRLADAGSNPAAVGAGRLLVGSLVIVALLPRFGQTRLEVIRLWRRPSVVASAVAVAIFQVAYFAGVAGAGVALGSLLLSGTAPVFAGLLGWRLGHGRPERMWFLATTICVSGLVLLSADGLFETATAGSVGSEGRLIGVICSIAAGVAVATYTVAAKGLLGDGVHPVTTMASTFVLGGLLLVPFVATVPLGWVVSTRGFGLILYLGVVTMAVANFLHLWGLQSLTPAAVATLMLAEPLTATLLGVAVLGEGVSPTGWMGVALVTGGLAVQTIAASRPPGRPEPNLDEPVSRPHPRPKSPRGTAAD